jgi:hypothetical protein
MAATTSALEILIDVPLMPLLTDPCRSVHRRSGVKGEDELARSVTTDDVKSYRQAEVVASKVSPGSFPA